MSRDSIGVDSVDWLVSIVTLTYKRFERIYEAIDSVLSQDYPRIEYIISDDGSPDFPEEEIRRYIQRKKQANIVNVNIILHDKNHGTVRNINDAYRNANGDIIIPVSADDTLFNQKVISRIVEQYKERKCNALVTGRVQYDESGNFVRKIPCPKAAKIIGELQNKQGQYRRFITDRFYEAFSGCVLTVKKDFIKEFGYFDEKYILWEDGPFFARYLWDQYMNCDFNIISLRYNVGGVSTSSKGQHPILLQDECLFRKTDRVKHIKEIPWIDRDILRYELNAADNPSIMGKMKAVIRHPIGFIILQGYKVRKQIMESFSFKKNWDGLIH